MKRVLIILAAVLAMASLVAAQAQTPGSTGAQPQTGTQQQPASGIDLTTGQAQQAAPPPPLKGVKSPPQAQTQEEYNAFMAASQMPDNAAAEQVANDYAAKFSTSQLTAQLYIQLLFKNLQAGNADKAVDMGRKALQLEPANPLVAIWTATVLAETTRDTDLDAAQKLDEAAKDANIGLQNLDTNLTVASMSISQEQVEQGRTDLRARAQEALGLVAFKKKNNAEAEKYLRQAIQTRGASGEAMTHLRLALTLDREERYADALTEAQKAASMAPPQDPVAKSAQAEIERLKMLSGSSGAAAVPSQPTPR